jgi:pilus assembly protein CpaE
MTPREGIQFASLWKFLFVCPQPLMTGSLSQALGRLFQRATAVEVPVYPPPTALAELLQSQSPNLCFVDVSSDRDRAVNLIAEMLARDPKLLIVAVLRGNDPDLILRCLRQGAAEFLIDPFTEDQIAQVLERIGRKFVVTRGDSGAAKIFCVMPSKGACGASTIASNLAFQWKRLGSKKILLADLDPLTGTVSFLLKLKSNYSFLDAVAHMNALDQDLWKALIVPNQGVDVLLSPEHNVDGIHELRDANGIVQHVRTGYETVVLDTGGVYGNWSLALARACDELLLVTTNELPALQATQRALSYLDQNRIDRSKVRLLVNRYNRDVGLSKEVIETALHTEVFHLLPSDYDAVQRALIDGKPIPSSSGFGKSLAALADRLAGKESRPQVEKSSSSTWGSLLGLFSRTSG